MFDTVTAFAMKVHYRIILAVYRYACIHRMVESEIPQVEETRAQGVPFMPGFGLSGEVRVKPKNKTVFSVRCSFLAAPRWPS
jgi:hypothetical protein